LARFEPSKTWESGSSCLQRRPWGGVGNKAIEKAGPELRSTGPDAMAAMALKIF